MAGTPAHPGSRTGLTADAAATAAVIILGLVLLRAGADLLSQLGENGPLTAAARSTSPAALEQFAGLCATGSGLLLTLGWLIGLACTLGGCVLQRLGFARAAARTLLFAPGPMRRLAAAALGLSLATGAAPAWAAATSTGPVASAAAAAGPVASAAGPMSAAPAGTVAPPDTVASASEDISGPGRAETPGGDVSPLWRPSPPRPPGLLVPAPRPDSSEVVVIAGDTLWSLAARQLGPLATDAEIAELWPRWHAHNHTVIGPDPDLLLPGQVLVPPPP